MKHYPLLELKIFQYSFCVKFFSIFFVMVKGIAINFTGYSQTIPKKTLLALSKNDHTLSIIDPSNLKILGTIPIGTDPHEVSTSDDGKMAFVTIYGGGSLHELDIIDLVSQKLIKALDTKPFLGPHGLMFADHKAWFTAEGSKSIASYNPAEDKLDWCLGTGQERTHMIYVQNDGKKI